MNPDFVELAAFVLEVYARRGTVSDAVAIMGREHPIWSARDVEIAWRAIDAAMDAVLEVI